MHKAVIIDNKNVSGRENPVQKRLVSYEYMNLKLPVT